MATDTSLTFYGLWYLAGQNVTVSIAGLDCGDYTVNSTTGAITVPFGSDAGGLMTAAYLPSISPYSNAQAVTFSYLLNDVMVTVTIPVTIGIVYQTKGQRLRAATAEEIKSPVGAALGKVRRTEIASFLLSNTGGLAVGTSFALLDDVLLPDTDGVTPIAATGLFTGVTRINLTDGNSYDSMVCWKIGRPWPCTICATSSFVHTEET